MAAFKSNIAGQKEAQEDLRGVENEMSSFLECEQIYSTMFSSDDEETLDAAMRPQTVDEEEADEEGGEGDSNEGEEEDQAGDSEERE